MILGMILIYALVAGVLAWLTEYICGRLGAPAWLTRVLYGATLCYVFWFLTTNGPIQIGR